MINLSFNLTTASSVNKALDLFLPYLFWLTFSLDFVLQLALTPKALLTMQSTLSDNSCMNVVALMAFFNPTMKMLSNCCGLLYWTIKLSRQPLFSLLLPRLHRTGYQYSTTHHNPSPVVENRRLIRELSSFQKSKNPDFRCVTFERGFLVEGFRMLSSKHIKGKSPKTVTYI